MAAGSFSPGAIKTSGSKPLASSVEEAIGGSRGGGTMRVADSAAVGNLHLVSYRTDQCRYVDLDVSLRAGVT